MYHDHKMAGHPGELETYNSIRQHYWWPGLQMLMRNYIQGCGMCQQFKINQSPLNPAYQAIEGAKTTRPFAHCSMDLTTNLPPVDGYDSILVVVDQGLSKGVILCPCAKTLTWEGAAIFLQDNLFKRFGLPDKMISDRDPQICCTCFPRTLETSEHLLQSYNCLPPTIRWSYGTSKSRNQSIFGYLLHVTPRRLATFPKHTGIHTQ